MRISKEKWKLLCNDCMELLSMKTKSKKLLEHKSSLISLLEQHYLGNTSEELYNKIKTFNSFFSKEITFRNKKEKISPKFSLDIINITFY